MQIRNYKWDEVIHTKDIKSYAMGKRVTRVFNALSLTFPVGERFFCESVRAFRDDCWWLNDEIDLFIKEEAQHSMQHKKLNNLFREYGVDVDKLEASALKRLNKYAKTDEDKLLITTCLEMFTQYGADFLLAFNKVIFDDSSVSELWRWHAREEAGAGHRSLAHKMLNEVRYTSNFKLRIFFVATTILLAMQCIENYNELKRSGL